MASAAPDPKAAVLRCPDPGCCSLASEESSLSNCRDELKFTGRVKKIGGIDVIEDNIQLASGLGVCDFVPKAGPEMSRRSASLPVAPESTAPPTVPPVRRRAPAIRAARKTGQSCTQASRFG